MIEIRVGPDTFRCQPLTGPTFGGALCTYDYRLRFINSAKSWSAVLIVLAFAW